MPERGATACLDSHATLILMSGEEIWDHVNESLSAAAWPFVVLVLVVVVLLFFKKQIGDRIKHIREANVGPAALKMDASREANEVLGETVPEVLGRLESKAITAGPDQTDDAEEGPAVVTGSARIEGRINLTAEADVAHAEGTVSSPEEDNLLARAEQVEEIIRASWRAGVEAGQSGKFDEMPEQSIVCRGSKPEIRGWTLVERPKTIPGTTRVIGAIKLGGGSGLRLGTQQPVSEEVLRLEAEIRRLRENGADLPRKSPTPDNKLYLDLLAKLRKIDPKSPFA